MGEGLPWRTLGALRLNPDILRNARRLLSAEPEAAASANLRLPCSRAAREPQTLLAALLGLKENAYALDAAVAFCRHCLLCRRAWPSKRHQRPRQGPRRFRLHKWPQIITTAEAGCHTTTCMLVQRKMRKVNSACSEQTLLKKLRQAGLHLRRRPAAAPRSSGVRHWRLLR